MKINIAKSGIILVALSLLCQTALPAAALTLQELLHNQPQGKVLAATTDGLVGYWSMNESSGTAVADGSGNGYTGTAQNNPTWASGYVGNALGFNGTSQYVTIPDNAALRLSGTPYTYSFWFRHAGSTSAVTGILSKFSGTGYFAAYNAGRLSIRHLPASGQVTVESNATISNNVWYHAAVVYNRSNLQLYINGSLDKQATATIDLGTDATGSLEFGRFSSNYFNGTLDEVRMYSRALSASEVVDLYTDGGAGSTPPPSDTTAPIASISAPTSGATVSGNVTVSANASDDTGVAGVQFLLNGANIGQEDTQAPYSISWSSTGVANGSYTISARARDAAGNLGITAGVPVTVSNASGSGGGSLPSTVSNLSASNTGSVSTGLTWSAPATAAGAAVSSYDVRFSTVTINDSNWASATQASGEPAPGAPTSPQTYTVSGLSPSTTYYVALRSSDSSGNTSALSNVASFTTTSTSGAMRTPLTDLGSQLYLGTFSGGLYENGSNSVPSDHNTAGLSIAGTVQPLNTSGSPSASGRIVLLSIGMSNTGMEFCAVDGTTSCDPNSFMAQAAADSRVNRSTLTIINGAQGGQDASSWDQTTDTNYNRVRDNLLAPAGLTEQQVQAAWVKLANIAPGVSLPSSFADAYSLETRLGNVLRSLKTRYPNLKQVFFSSRTYGGWATGDLNPEPYAYETGFAPKWIIQAQVSQMRNNGTVTDSRAGNLNYNTGTAPWVAWGPYIWADGTNARSDGFSWARSDFISDGVHPSSSGIQKVGNQLLSFFLSSPYTGWFRSTGGPVGDTTPPVRSSGSPSGQLPAGTTQVTLALSTNETATCRYSTSASTAYASMTSAFASTNSTSHSQTITGLSNGTSRTYYVRCQDSAGNANGDDFTISFSVSTASTISGTVWYVAPNGSPSGNGSISSPWDLQTALNHPSAVQPGHTIYLRGGTYNGPFRSFLTGTPANRIIVKSYPGENAILDNPNNIPLPGVQGIVGASASLTASGNYVRYERLTLTNSFPKRVWGADEWMGPNRDGVGGCYPNCLGDGVQDSGLGNQFIHNVIHNVGIAFGSQGGTGNGSLYYGNITYYIGWAERGSANYNGRGHAFYVQNNCNTGRKIIENNIDFFGTSHSQQIYGSSGAVVGCVDSVGNVILNNGNLALLAGINTATELSASGMLLGGNARATDLGVRNNVVVNTESCATKPRTGGFRPAYLIAPNGLDVRNNYFKGCGSIAYDLEIPNLTHSGNVWVGNTGNSPALVQAQFAGDSFYAYDGDPANRITERWSTFDPTWGYLTIVNNTNASTITWNPTGCSNGEVVELREIMNHTGSPVHTFTCDGTGKAVTMNYSGPVIQPIGEGVIPVTHPGNGFRVFLLTKTGGSTPPVNAAPVISSFTASPVSITSGGSSTLSWNVSGATSLSINQNIGTVTGTSRSVSPVQTTFYTLTATNSSGSATANVTVTVTPPADTTAPTISTVVSSGVSQTGATISWTTNEAADTQVEYGLTTSYGQATALQSTLSTSHAVTIGGLSAGLTYNYRVVSRDAAGNVSRSGNLTFQTAPSVTPDTTPPAAVSDLSPANITQTSVDLVTWTAPGDDGNIGTASAYDLRYSSGSVITNATFASAIQASGLPAPLPAGTRQTYILVGLTPGTTYSAALKTSDEAGNISGISNIVTFTTLASAMTPSPTPNPSPSPSPSVPIGVTDTTPPPAVSNSKADGLDAQVVLSWTNPATDSDYVRTIVVRKEGSTAPASATDGTKVYEGTAETYTDTALENGREYAYAIFTIDRVPNYSVAAMVTAKPEAGKTQVSTTNPNPAASVSASSVSLKLVNISGTYYLIKNGVRHGITLPGMLFSYGFALNQAKVASEDEKQLPEGDILLPGDGVLVKTKDDPTVWLISSNKRHGFVSATVFNQLGFKFSQVLVVTAPELQKQEQGPNLDDGTKAHLPGTNINQDGTIYWMGPDSKKYPYPSLEVYNSWNIPGDFSRVLPANAEDRKLPVGEAVERRVLE